MQPQGTQGVQSAGGTPAQSAQVQQPLCEESRYVNPAAAAAPPSASAEGPAAAAPSPLPKQKGRGWIVGLAAVLMFGAVSMFGIQSCSSSMASLSPFASAGDAPSAASEECVGVIELASGIDYDGSACSPEGFKQLLDSAAANPNVKALVIRVNSGGGTATAGEEMTAYLKRFKEETGKPVVVSCAAVCASAAYQIASQADYIYAAKSSAVGGIGTILSVASYAELMDKLGISIENIKSAESKDSSYGTRELTAEERKHYQHQVDQITQNFVQAVAEGRGMAEADVKKLATGLTYTGTDSVENGLVDALGTRQDAVSKASELAGCKDLQGVSLQQESEDWGSLVDLLGSSKTDADRVLSALEELSNEQAVQ